MVIKQVNERVAVRPAQRHIWPSLLRLVIISEMRPGFEVRRLHFLSL